MTVKVGLVGTGTVGGGCIDVFNTHADDYKRHFGIDIELARVCSRHPEAAKARGKGDIWTNDYHDIVNDPDIDIVVELIGGTTVARDVILEAFAAGKNVVTANKALLATHGEEIMHAADAAGKELMFEAAVAGGIPIISPLKHSLIANKITSVLGIVNGTTNYMLSRMAEEGMGYDEALADAQARGFAEADPTADVDGFDAAAKIAIMASIAFNSRVRMDQVTNEGIRTIRPTDLAAAKDMGYCVKLLAVANRTDAGIDVRVHPTMVPLSHPLASVSGVNNAVYVTGDFVGDAMFYGQGAGAGATASAVMGDVLEIARHVQAGVAPLVGCTCTDDLPIVPMGELVSRYYIRFVVDDRSGVLAKTSAVFAKHGVSVYSVVQRGKGEGGGAVDLVYITHSAREADMRAVIEDIKQLDGVLVGSEEPTVIRVQK